MKKLNPDLTMAVTSAAILFASFVGNVHEGRAMMAGIPMPPLCAFKLLTSLDCPGCGLTRSLILAAHGHLLQSYYMHIWGIPLFILLIAQVPYRLLRYFRPELQFPKLPHSLKKWISPAVFLSFLLPWAVKIAASLLIQYL